MKTVSVKMNSEQAMAFAKWLGEHRVAELPLEVARLVHEIHVGLCALARHADTHTLDVSAIDSVKVSS